MAAVTIEDVLSLASFSECSRRKYGAVITDYSGWPLSTGYNKRVGTCCNGVCVRDRLGMEHGQNTDSGAEVHAEQAALISLRYNDRGNRVYVAGLDSDGTPFNGFQNRPCYSCSRMLKYGGFETVYLPFDGEWQSVSIDDIMENWELTWK